MHVTTVFRDLHAFLERQSILVYIECIFNRRTEHCKDDSIVDRYANVAHYAASSATVFFLKKKGTLQVLERSLI